MPHALRFLIATDPDALTLVQRFGSALNLNVRFHMLFVDGVYLADDLGELQTLVEQIASRVGRVLERRGLVERDIENAWLAGDGDGGPLDDLLGHSITYRIAVGPRAGQKLFTLQTVPARAPESLDDPNGAARAGGFSLHAGIDIAPHQRSKLERLCRYVSRPPVATERMALTSSGHVQYALKLRAAVTPAHRGTGASKQPATAGESAKPPTPRHVAMSWARRLKRVFWHRDR